MQLLTGAPGRIVVALVLAVTPFFGPAWPVGAARPAAPREGSAGVGRAAKAVAPRCADAPTHASTGLVAGGHAAGEYEVAFGVIAGVIASHLPWPLSICHRIVLRNVDIPLPGGGNAGALTGVYDRAGGISGAPYRCVVEVSKGGQLLPERDWRIMLAHEVFHCFQGEIMPLPTFNSGRYAWIVEGQADWVAESVVPSTLGADRQSRASWEGYLLHPETPLFARSYDAIGFYAHLAESGTDPWQIFEPMLRASSDRAAYAAAGGGADRFLNSWASGYFRGLDVAKGRDWDTTGPAIPLADAGHAVPRRIGVANGGVVPLAAAPVTNGIYVLDSRADILRVAATGHARVSDGSVDTILGGTSDFCTRAGGCACPPGGASPGGPPTSLAARADLALTGGLGGATVALRGISLEDFCGKKPAPLPGGPGGPLPSNPCTLFRRGDVVPYLSAGVPYAIQSTANSYGGGRFLCTYAVSYKGKHPVTDKTDNFAFGTAFGLDQMLASGEYKPFPGYGERSLLHLDITDSGDLAELLVHRGGIWFVVSVEYNYPDAQAHAHSGRSALAACKALTRTVLSRW